MKTISEIVTNGSQYKLYFDNAEYFDNTRYIKFDDIISILETVKFSNHTINISYNSLSMKFDEALKLVKKLQTKFEKLGFLISYNLEDVNGNAEFYELGNSYIHITKPSQL